MDPIRGEPRVPAQEEAMDRFDDGEIEEFGDRRRIRGRRGPTLARCVATVMVITVMLAAAAKAIPA